MCAPSYDRHVKHPLVNLLKSMRAAMWRNSIFGERLKVEDLEGGGVRLVLELTAEEVLDDRPKLVSSGPKMGASTPKT